MPHPFPTVAISQQERAFFIAFGERLAALRKAGGPGPFSDPVASGGCR
jgi:hypothetical protein